ncbi:ankyrin [Apiospora kogelbergensis]|uniref:ankyrin n=1 Tax=Apiospora kogelbergensis TaxID=1337665 RepID=UPI0031311D0C
MNGTDTAQRDKVSSSAQQQAKQRPHHPNGDTGGDDAAAKQSSMLLSHNNHRWGGVDLMADLDPNSIMSDAFPSPGPQHNHGDFHFMNTPECELISTMNLHDIESLITTTGDDTPNTASCLDFEKILASYQNRHQDQNQDSPPNSLRKSKTWHAGSSSSDTPPPAPESAPEFAHALGGPGAADADGDGKEPADGSPAAPAFRGYNAVHLAAHHGRQSMVRLLLQTHPDGRVLANAVNDDGQTSLHVAAARGHVDVVRELLSLGAEPGLQDHRGQIPLHIAVSACSPATVQLLLDQDVDRRLAHTVDAGGHTPLHRAVFEGTEEIVRVLLNRGGGPGGYY